jgi:hypothetical protein
MYRSVGYRTAFFSATGQSEYRLSDWRIRKTTELLDIKSRLQSVGYRIHKKLSVVQFCVLVQMAGTYQKTLNNLKLLPHGLPVVRGGLINFSSFVHVLQQYLLVHCTSTQTEEIKNT